MVHIAQFVCIPFARMTMWWEQIKTHRRIHCVPWCCCCSWDNNVYIYIWLLTDIFTAYVYHAQYHQFRCINNWTLNTNCVYRWNKVTFDFTPANSRLHWIGELTHVHSRIPLNIRNTQLSSAFFLYKSVLTACLFPHHPLQTLQHINLLSVFPICNMPPWMSADQLNMSTFFTIGWYMMPATSFPRGEKFRHCSRYYAQWER